MTISSTPSTASARGRDAIIAAALAALVLVVLLLTVPFANVPMNDDFTYARTAEALARTGHILYNGWGSPLLWPQAVYGALVIRFFGFSYAALAKTGVFLAVGATALFYLLARRCGCRRRYAVLATLALMLNPIFLSVAPSFMTDIPSLALYLLMLHTLIRAIGRNAEGVVSIDPRWLALSTIVAVIAGSNRQLIWFTDLAALAVLFALVPHQRKVIGIAFGVVLDCAIAMNYWYDSQPYSVSPNPDEGVRRLIAMPGAVALGILRYLDLGGVLLFPVALLAVPRLKAQCIGPRAIVVTALVWLALIMAPYPISFRMPSFGVYAYAEYFTSQGALVGGPPGYLRRPIILGSTFSFALTLAGVVSLAVFSLLLWQFVRTVWNDLRARRRSDATLSPPPNALQNAILGVLLSASLVQFAASFLWFCANYLFDRYLLLFIPGFLIFLGVQASRLDGKREGKQSPFLARIAVGATALMTVLGFGIAQEYAAYGHARAELYHWLRGAGVPQTAINGGLELDADAQIVANGYVNSPQVIIPKGAFKPGVVSPHISFLGTEFPAIDPLYRITTDSVILPNEDAYPTPLRVATYHSLLPPFERHMYVYCIKR